MTVSEVQEIYINQGKNLVDTAKELGVNPSVLRAFITKNKITKDPEVLRKLERNRKKAEEWAKMNSSGISE